MIIEETTVDPLDPRGVSAAIGAAMSRALESTDAALRDLRAYLEAHERDIAHDIDDFGTLREAFDLFLGRKPTA